MKKKFKVAETSVRKTLFAGVVCASALAATLAHAQSVIGSQQIDAVVFGRSQNCIFNGVSVPSGQSIVAYLANRATAGSRCETQIRQCQNGVLSGNYAFAACSVETAAAGTCDQVSGKRYACLQTASSVNPPPLNAPGVTNGNGATAAWSVAFNAGVKVSGNVDDLDKDKCAQLCATSYPFAGPTRACNYSEILNSSSAGRGFTQAKSCELITEVTCKTSIVAVDAAKVVSATLSSATTGFLCR